MPRHIDRDARLDVVCGAVLAVAAREGFHEVTIRRVAAEAGASTSIVTHYVAGRDELLRLAVRRLVEIRRGQLQAVLDERAPNGPADALSTVVRWAVLETDEADRLLWLALLVGAQREQVLREELDAYNAWWDSVVGRLARELAPGSGAAQEVADAVDVVVDGLLVAELDAGEPWPSSRRARLVDGLLASYGL